MGNFQKGIIVLAKESTATDQDLSHPALNQVNEYVSKFSERFEDGERFGKKSRIASKDPNPMACDHRHSPGENMGAHRPDLAVDERS